MSHAQIETHAQLEQKKMRGTFGNPLLGRFRRHTMKTQQN